MPITITPEHYQKLYQDKFSSRGLALLRKGAALTEEEKAAFCADILFRFDPDTATPNDFKDMMLALKFVIDKNISTGRFLNGILQEKQEVINRLWTETRPRHSQVMGRDLSLSADDLDHPEFVSSLLILHHGGGREVDCAEISKKLISDIDNKISQNNELLEVEKLINYAVNFTTNLGALEDALYGNYPTQERAEMVALVKGNQNLLEALDYVKYSFRESFKVEPEIIPRPSRTRRFFIGALNIVSNILKPERPKSFIGRIFGILKPYTPNSFLGRIYNFFSNKLHDAASYLHAGHVSNFFASEGIIVNQAKGLLNSEVMPARDDVARRDHDDADPEHDRKYGFEEKVIGEKKQVRFAEKLEEVIPEPDYNQAYRKVHPKPKSGAVLSENVPAHNAAYPVLTPKPVDKQVEAKSEAEVKASEFRLVDVEPAREQPKVLKSEEVEELEPLSLIKDPPPFIPSGVPAKPSVVPEEIEFDVKEGQDVVEPRSKLWLIAHAENTDAAIMALTGGRSILADITLEEYQALMVSVALEIDKIGVAETGHTVDSGAYSIVDQNNKLFNFFKAYYDKVQKEFTEKNMYAYSRDPVKWGYLEIDQSSHPGTDQMGFDIRRFDVSGALDNIFEGIDREPKKHILVSKLGDGKTYLKLEKIGIGTKADFVDHGFDWFWTRKPVEKMMDKMGYVEKRSSSPARKEHAVNIDIKNTYKEIERNFIDYIKSLNKDDLSFSEIKGVIKISRVSEVVYEDDWMVFDGVEEGEIERSKFIFEMYENLRNLSRFCDDNDKQAAEYISQFEKVCESCGYDPRYLAIRHGHEVVVDLDAIPEFERDIGILGFSHNQVIREILDIRQAFFGVVDMVFPNDRATLDRLGLTEGLQSKTIRSHLRGDAKKYPKDDIVVARALDYLSEQGECPRLSELIDLPYPPQLGSKEDTRQQSVINLAMHVTDKEEDTLLKKLYSISNELSAAASQYYKVCCKLQDPRYRDEVENIGFIKEMSASSLNNAVKELAVLKSRLLDDISVSVELKEQINKAIFDMQERINNLSKRIFPEPKLLLPAKKL